MPLLPFAVAALVKASLYTFCESVDVQGLDNLLRALKSGKGVLTVSNHISIIDDPCAVSAALPLRYFLSSKTTRWTLGASDICFINAPTRFFFNNGQVIETYRSSANIAKAGIYQPALDLAIKKIDQGQWLHIFPEAKVHQHPQHELLRFRWGTSRILMEAKNDYEVIPIWLEGFDDLMPADRTFPRFIPRFFGTRIRVIIGPSISSRIKPIVQAYRDQGGHPTPYCTLDADRPRPRDYKGDSELVRNTRIEIARVLREEVEKLGKRTTDFGIKNRDRELKEVVTEY